MIENTTRDAALINAMWRDALKSAAAAIIESAIGLSAIGLPACYKKGEYYDMCISCDFHLECHA